MSSSCSFRITRTAEDLAQTINALSQRLVKLEKRQETLELKLSQSYKEPSPEEKEMLDGVDQILQECQELLGTSTQNNAVEEGWSEEDQQNAFAA